LELESETRHERRVTRLRRASRLPTAKTFETFDDKRLINVNYFCRSTTTILAGLGLGDRDRARPRGRVVAVQDWSHVLC
jgi:hypothetical protein